ncbi:Phosphoglycerate mutase [Phytophthora megakarya]|uniref:Phosphoglycerate mutase n=1 Tax=Phytophthora megakarya TaxID=4795 RepID=A0A225V1J5_9STRA|nr:Phosphoglycerate mutase [Phytophthora megakarya]
MTETTGDDANSASTPAAPTSVRSVDGFFAPKTPIENDETVSLFKRFQLVPPSWDEFERKLHQLEKPEDNADVSRQVKVVYFVRHAEGVHNAADKQFGSEKWESELAFQEKYLDADLTPFGVNDAESKGPSSVQAELERGMPFIERVVVSPLSRAIQTAKHFFTKDQLPETPFSQN